MKINDLNKKELINLREEIDCRIKEQEQIEKDIEKAKKSITNKSKLSHLYKNDSIYGISFKGDKIYEKGYAKIKIGKIEDGYADYSTFDDKTPHGLGCSSSINAKYMDKHYFLVGFCGGHYYFFTLKPEKWEEDIKDALDTYLKTKRNNFNNEIKVARNNIKSFIKEYKKNG
jgi:hypothetical protein